MNIAIIGSGNVGSALASGWNRIGHKVVFGVRDPGSGKANKAKEALSAVPLLSIKEAASQNDIIVIATPPDAVHDLIPQLGEVDDKVMIDTTNSFRARPDGFPTVYHALQALTHCKHLVKCFNSTGYENMSNPVYQVIAPILHEEHLDMFMAGDSHHAKQICIELSKGAGFHDCYDFGGSDKVELLEQFALSWINLAIFQGMGRGIAFKLIKR
jgi:8-hydroxy-5-deazaflavin:NADPH oxidoreductase